MSTTSETAHAQAEERWMVVELSTFLSSAGIGYGDAPLVAVTRDKDSLITWLKAEVRTRKPFPCAILRGYKDQPQHEADLVVRMEQGLQPGQWVDRFQMGERSMAISGYGGGPPFSFVVE